MVSAETLGNHHPVPGHAISAARGSTVQQRQLHELGQVQEADVVLDKKRRRQGGQQADGNRHLFRIGALQRLQAVPPFLFDQGLHMGMTCLDLLPVDAPYRAYTQQVQAGYGAVDGRLIVAAQGMQQCLQAAHPRLVQRRTCALVAFGDPGFGCDHSRQLHVALRRHAGDGKAMCGAAFQRGAVLQKLLRGVQVACGLLEGATVACACCCFAQKLQERFAVIRCKPAGAGALQLVGELEQCFVQVAWPGLSHGQGNTCMQLGTRAYGR